MTVIQNVPLFFVKMIDLSKYTVNCRAVKVSCRGHYYYFFSIRTDSAVRGSLHPTLKMRTDSAVRGSLHLALKIRTDSAVRGHLSSQKTVRLGRSHNLCAKYRPVLPFGVLTFSDRQLLLR